MDAPSTLYIDGEWVPASDGATLDVVDPATEEKVGTVPVATPDDLDRALAAADRAWRGWRAVDAWTRSAALRKVAALLRERLEETAAVLTGEQGKPLAEARAELAATADQFDWYADEARRIYGRTVDGHSRANRLIVIRQPVGPIAAFAPWNFPALLPARKIAPALAAGCSVIVKPAEEAPRTCLCLARACHDAGIPPGVLNVVTGRPAQISAHLVRSPVIRKVSLTGSVPVGRELMRLCAEQVKPVSLELGGSSAVLVFADADVDKAAELCARAKFRNMGQVCISASRFFVQQPVVERFTARFVEVARSLRVGDGREPGTDVGPLSNRRRLEATEALVADAVGKGARLLAGGGRPQHLRRGFYFLPTVLDGVRAGMRLLAEEPFCPVAPIAPFGTLEEGLALANASDFGLAGYVFTRDTRTAFLASEGLEAGLVGVNHLGLAAAEIPFGGVKLSGFGREGGCEGIEDFTTTKTINFLL